MSLSDGSGLSATDIMALTGNNDGFGGGFGGGWWVILFILLLFGGGFGYGRGICSVRTVTLRKKHLI